jgi:hypothetical protein
LILVTTVVGAKAQTAVQLDGIAAVVNGEVITQSDVRAARLLRLVEEAANASDALLIRALINRRLELAEVRRYAPPEPAAAEIAARRRQWEATLPPGSNVADLLARTWMTEAALTIWLRDDVRLKGYLAQKFSASPDRAARMQRWVDGLFERAEVMIK